MKENNSFLQSFESGDDDDPKRRDKFRLIMVARKRWVWSYLNSDQLQISTTLDFKYLSIRQVQPWMLKLFCHFVCQSNTWPIHSYLIQSSIDRSMSLSSQSIRLSRFSQLQNSNPRVEFAYKPNPTHHIRY